MEGWGAVDNKGTYPGKLYEVQVPVVGLEVCRNRYENWKEIDGKFTYKGRIYGGNLCAGDPGKDSCTVSFIFSPGINTGKFKIIN